MFSHCPVIGWQPSLDPLIPPCSHCHAHIFSDPSLMGCPLPLDQEVFRYKKTYHAVLSTPEWTQAPRASNIPLYGPSPAKPEVTSPSTSKPCSGFWPVSYSGSRELTCRYPCCLPAASSWSTQTRRASGSGHSQLYLKGHSDWERFLRSGRQSVSLLSSRRAQRRTWGTADWSASPRSLAMGRSKWPWKPIPDTWGTRR